MKFEDLRESTKKIYESALEKIPGDMYDHENVMKYTEVLTSNQKRTLFKALTHFDEKNKPKYTEMLNEFSKKDQEERESKQLKTYSQKELDMLKLFKEVIEENDKSGPYIEKYNELEDGTRDKVLLMLHLFHPLRSDYYTVKIRGYDVTEDNYYTKGTITFNETVKVKRKLTIQLTEDEQKVIDSYIRTLPEETTSLFEWSSSNSYTQALGRIGKRIFGHKVSINTFRHLKDFPDSIKEIYKEINQMAISMNHSLGTHVENY